MISKKARLSETQEQSPIGVPMKRCSENMQQIYRTPYFKNTSGWLLEGD